MALKLEQVKVRLQLVAVTACLVTPDVARAHRGALPGQALCSHEESPVLAVALLTTAWHSA
jgi:hypothetical protein